MRDDTEHNTGHYVDDGTPPGGPTTYWQNALNQHFPAHARHLQDRPRPIPVSARIVWERDGEEWISGTAIRWDADHVLVRIGDRRWSTHGVWLAPTDVRRRDPDANTAADTDADSDAGRPGDVADATDTADRADRALG